jgi:hypothetical protein
MSLQYRGYLRLPKKELSLSGCVVLRLPSGEVVGVWSGTDVMSADRLSLDSRRGAWVAGVDIEERYIRNGMAVGILTCSAEQRYLT